MSAVGSLEKAAQARKERLKALRQANTLSSSSGETSSIPRPPIFRSYKPQDKKLQENQIPLPKLSDVEAQVKEQIGDITEPSKSSEQAVAAAAVDDVDITELAPRKPDWDLKRDITKKLARLEHRTQKAIGELIRERFLSAPEGDSDNLAAAVSGAAARESESSSDEGD